MIVLPIFASIAGGFFLAGLFLSVVGTFLFRLFTGKREVPGSLVGTSVIITGVVFSALLFNSIVSGKHRYHGDDDYNYRGRIGSRY